MKDVKVLQYYYTGAEGGLRRTLITRTVGKSTYTEKINDFPAVEVHLKQYLSQGYRITQFAGDSGNLFFVLEQFE